METKPICPVCNGSGRIRAKQGFFAVEKNCPNCNSDVNSDRKPQQETDLRLSGYVYILYVSAGMLKIGHTRRHPEDRASEWELELLAFARAEDSGRAEKKIHEILSKHRCGKYEIFETSFVNAVQVVESVAGPVKIIRHP